MKNSSLIIYYSWSGNTEKVAELISEKVDGKLFKLDHVQAYPTEYDDCTEQAEKEIKSGFLPELKAFPDDLDKYDTIYIGSPNWWWTMAPPVSTFLNHADLSGKTIVPFLTHGGDGKGRYTDDLEKQCPASRMLEDLTLKGSDKASFEAEVINWLKRIGMLISN